MNFYSAWPGRLAHEHGRDGRGTFHLEVPDPFGSASTSAGRTANLLDAHQNGRKGRDKKTGRYSEHAVGQGPGRRNRERCPEHLENAGISHFVDANAARSGRDNGGKIDKRSRSSQVPERDGGPDGRRGFTRHQDNHHKSGGGEKHQPPCQLFAQYARLQEAEEFLQVFRWNGFGAPAPFQDGRPANGQAG